MAKDTSLTKPQIAAYWRAASAAARNVGEPLDTYRKRVMREECGVESVKALNRTGDFDKVMARFAVDAGDYGAAGHFATADARRLVVLIRICCAQVMQLKGEPEGATAAAAYLAGIVRQARLDCGLADGCFWIDCPADSLLALFQMLDTHRRRLLRGIVNPDGLGGFLGFDPDIVYRPMPGGGVKLAYNGSFYASYAGVKIALK